MVAEEREGTAGARQVQHLGGARPPVHQVPQEHQAVAPLQLQLFQQVGEFVVAAVDVSHGNEASGHECAARGDAAQFASVRGPGK